MTRRLPLDPARCAVCGLSRPKLVRFMLYCKVTANGRPTTRGAGSILMCQADWKVAKADSTAHSRRWRAVAA